MERGAIGDIGFRWFDKEGKKIVHDYEDRTIGYDVLEKADNCKVVALAGGEKKHEAVLGALRGQFVDVLITDSETAKYLIDNKNRR